MSSNLLLHKAFFAMPFFDWKNSAGYLWVYWASTIPTTLVVGLVYTIWFLLTVRYNKRAARKAREEVPGIIEGPTGQEPWTARSLKDNMYDKAVV